MRFDTVLEPSFFPVFLPPIFSCAVGLGGIYIQNIFTGVACKIYMGTVICSKSDTSEKHRLKFKTVFVSVEMTFL
jgi:hypothetical protein